MIHHMQQLHFHFKAIYISMHTILSAALQELSKPAFFASENHQTILGKFADFQTNVCNKLLMNGVDAEQARLCWKLISPIDCIPPPPAALKDFFGAITRHRLWGLFLLLPINTSCWKVWRQWFWDQGLGTNLQERFEGILHGSKSQRLHWGGPSCCWHSSN